MDRKIAAGQKECDTNEQIRRQVYVIAETILHIAKSVEEALVNISAVKNVLNQVTLKLNHDQLICPEEKALLELAEQWLTDERIQYDGDLNNNITTLNLSQISALGNSFLSATTTDNGTYSSCLTTPTIPRKFQTGSTQTLDEETELDWDGNGVDLMESVHSGYTASTTAFKDPYTLCNSLIESDDSTNDEVTKSNSYSGIYEEEMEFTLEVEEGFYSDSSSIENGFEDNILQSDFSPQADSGVTHLDCNTSTDRSISHADDDLTIGTTPSYNREINTWDMFATVNLEEDLLSTASSANNSNNSTPQLVRKRKSLMSPDNSLRPLSEHSPLSNAKFHDSSNSLQKISAERLRANSVGAFRFPSSPTGKRKFESLPRLSTTGVENIPYKVPVNPAKDIVDLDIELNHNAKNIGGSDEEFTSSPNVTGSDSSSTLSSKLSVQTSILTGATLPPSLKKNNYYTKSRRAVLV